MGESHLCDIHRQLCQRKESEASDGMIGCKQRIVCGTVSLFATKSSCTKAEVQATFVHSPLSQLLRICQKERLASMYLTALSLSDTSMVFANRKKRQPAKEKHRRIHQSGTPKLYRKDVICRTDMPRIYQEMICFFAVSSAAMTLSHHVSNSGSSFWHSGCARI